MADSLYHNGRQEVLVKKLSDILYPPEEIDGDKIALEVITKHKLEFRK